mgnify:CR=1 FL=1
MDYVRPTVECRTILLYRQCFPRDVVRLPHYLRMEHSVGLDVDRHSWVRYMSECPPKFNSLTENFSVGILGRHRVAVLGVAKNSCALQHHARRRERSQMSLTLSFGDENSILDSVTAKRRCSTYTCNISGEWRKPVRYSLNVSIMMSPQ